MCYMKNSKDSFIDLITITKILRTFTKRDFSEHYSNFYVNLSTFKKSADIKIVTIFFISSF